jgi:hypothetical protein
MEALTDHLSKLPKEISPEPIFAQMQKLGEKKAELEEKLTELRSQQSMNELPATFEDYQAFCKSIRLMLGNESNGDFRNQILRKLIHKVEVTPSSYKIHYFVGENVIVSKVLHQ